MYKIVPFAKMENSFTQIFPNSNPTIVLSVFQYGKAFKYEISKMKFHGKGHEKREGMEIQRKENSQGYFLWGSLTHIFTAQLSSL